MLDEDEARNGGSELQQALEPVEQESILFHGETIIAVRLADGRICVVLRWVCDSMKLQAGGQVRKIERTSAIAGELVRVRVQTKGGKQTMPAITLRGFSPWMLTINPNEIKNENSGEEERIRALVVAFQEEAKDVLYEYFVNKRRPTALPPEPGEARAAVIVREATTSLEPVKPQEPEQDAKDAEQTAYYEDLALWALWKARQYAQKWRGEVETWRGTVEARLESQEAISGLLPEIIDRLGPETITPQHQRQVQAYVKRLHEASGKAYPTIYDDLRIAFEKPRYQELLESEWPQVEHWFIVQIEQARKPRR